MYSKTSKQKLSSSAKIGAVLVMPAQGSPPKDALACLCDGCGAQLWIPGAFTHLLQEGNHKTFCLMCLQLRKVV